MTATLTRAMIRQLMPKTLPSARTAGTLARLGVGLCLAFTLVAGARSQDDSAAIVYDVELVVFRNLEVPATPEDWSLEARLTDVPLAQTVVDEDPSSVVPAIDVEPGIAREPLPREKFKLNAIAASLQRSRSYRPIAHFGWSQAGSPLNAAVSAPLDTLTQSAALRGSAALARGRYLHLTLDLAFQPEDGQERFILRQTRRMRSNERHYFDHPRFGVIALVTPHAVPGRDTGTTRQE